jgi:hypothetical protein
MEEIQKPSIGRVVLVERGDGEPVSNGQRRAPAIVQTAWDGGLLVNVCVLPDCATPFNATSIDHASKSGSPGLRWVWPPRT